MNNCEKPCHGIWGYITQRAWEIWERVRVLESRPAPHSIQNVPSSLFFEKASICLNREFHAEDSSDHLPLHSRASPANVLTRKTALEDCGFNQPGGGQE
eukprot:6177955-Pleurochrysis_carterae.AAC.11